MSWKENFSPSLVTQVASCFLFGHPEEKRKSVETACPKMKRILEKGGWERKMKEKRAPIFPERHQKIILIESILHRRERTEGKHTQKKQPPTKKQKKTKPPQNTHRAARHPGCRRAHQSMRQKKRIDATVFSTPPRNQDPTDATKLPRHL